MLEDLIAERAPDCELLLGYIVRTPDDTLFLGGGAHDPFLYKAGLKTIESSSYMYFDANLKARRAYSERAGARYLHAIVPDKEGVPTASLPKSLDLVSLIDRYKANTAEAFIDLRPDGPMPAYFKRVDTHWAIPGEIAAAEKILHGFGIPEPEITAGMAKLRAAISPETYPAKGDLGRALLPQMMEQQPRFDSAWMTNFNSADTGWNIGKTDIFLAPESPDRRLLIFGDSCMHIAARMLTPFFRTILFCRTEFYHREMVDQMRPTHIMSEQIERFLRKIEPDTSAPRFLLYPHMFGRQLALAPEFWQTMNTVLTPPETVSEASPETQPQPLPVTPLSRRSFWQRVRDVFIP